MTESPNPTADTAPQASTVDGSILERLKRAWNIQLVRIQKIRSPLTMGLLMVNLSLLVPAQGVVDGVDPVWLVAGTFAIVALTVLLAANLYILWLDMHQEERRAEIQHNPYQVYAPLPWEEIRWRWIRMPTYHALTELARDAGVDAEELEDALDDWERVLDLGYIPREDFPDHLQDFYVARKEGRV